MQDKCKVAMPPNPNIDLDKKALIAIMDELRSIIPPDPDMYERKTWPFDVKYSSTLDWYYVSQNNPSSGPCVDYLYPLYLECECLALDVISTPDRYVLTDKVLKKYHYPKRLKYKDFYYSKGNRMMWKLDDETTAPAGQYKDLFNYWFHMLTIARKHHANRIPQGIDLSTLTSWHAMDIPSDTPGLEHMFTERRVAIKYVDIYTTNPDTGEKNFDYVQSQLVLGMYMQGHNTPIYGNITIGWPKLQNSRYYYFVHIPYKAWPMLKELWPFFMELARYKSMSRADMFALVMKHGFTPTNHDIGDKHPNVGVTKLNDYAIMGQDKSQPELRNNILSELNYIPAYRIYRAKPAGEVELDLYHVNRDNYDDILDGEVMMVTKPGRWMTTKKIHKWPALYVSSDATFEFYMMEQYVMELANRDPNVKPSLRKLEQLAHALGFKNMDRLNKLEAPKESIVTPGRVVAGIGIGVLLYYIYRFLKAP